MFYNKLQVEQQYDGKTWKLLNHLIYEDAVFGPIGVHEGYLTDFASVPRVPVLFDLVGDIGQSAATVHDWLYDNGHMDKSGCDSVFYRALLDCGVGPIRAWIMYMGVHLFGFHAFKKARSKKQ